MCAINIYEVDCRQRNCTNKGKDGVESWDRERKESRGVEGKKKKREIIRAE